ncbi:hypothetical protein BGW80DRAFT_1448133 [Lactifluus volemus]|nr:hypothetical protein BGW80DRAFT_1448133 [Lactifluus volemus]
MSTAPAPPLKKQRLIALAVSLVSCIIGGSIGLNALIKSNQAQIDIQAKVPSGVTVHLKNTDIYVAGIIVSAVCATIALLAVISILVTVVRPGFATRFLKTQGIIFNTFNMTLLSNHIVYTINVANNGAKITAFRDGVKLPQETAQAIVTATGQSTKYSKQHPAVLLAIFGWFSVLFTSILVVILIVATRRRDKTRAASGMSTPEKKLTQADEI